MAARAERDRPRARIDRAERGRLLRLASWVSLAALAVTGAVSAARSDVGAQRLALVMGHDAGPRPTVATSPPQPAPAPAPASGATPVPAADLDARTLTEAVRRLSAERERLLARLEAREDTVEVTGSVAKVSPKPVEMSTHARIAPAAAAPAAPSTEAKRVAAPETTSAAAPAPAPLPPTVALASALPQDLAPEAKPRRLEFAVDLGAAPNMEALRALWLTVKAQQGALLDELRPQVAMRPGGRGGETELRLLAGPLGNHLMAGRICAVLSATGRPCQTATFEGVRLATR